MYHVSDAASVLRARRSLFGRDPSAPRVNRTVVLLGLTSLFTDIAAEMVVTVLPLYLVFVGQFTPLAFGAVDGIQRGAASLAGVASGFLGDRLKRHKEIAAVGYGLSALVKLALAAVGTTLSAISALILIDRIGKGIRTAPRDAMISLSTPREQLGAAFGVHRALDTMGAMLGPLLAFAILAIAMNAYTSVFFVAFCFAVIGLGILVLLVPSPKPDPDAEVEPETITMRAALGVARLPRFRALVVVAGGLGFATVSDAFVFLVLQERLDLSLGLFPLLFVGMTAVYMLLAIPVGRIADRVGRGRVLLGGHALLLCVYCALIAPLDGPLLVALALVLMGAYYAATDGVLAALTSTVVPAAGRGSGLALINMTTGVARLVSSIAFGALWTLTSTPTAVAVFGGALTLAMTVAAVALARTREDARLA